MYDTYMSTPGNTSKLGAIHSNIQTAQSSPSLVGSEPIALVSTLLSQHTIPLCQLGIKLQKSSKLLLFRFRRGISNTITYSARKLLLINPCRSEEYLQLANPNEYLQNSHSMNFLLNSVPPFHPYPHWEPF